ncbi:MAG: hypothetical protein ACLFNX_02960 [Spirochaetaceae bacterium]
MGPNLKFTAYFAGSAFVIAVLTGAVAGVGFGTLVLRAVIGAIVFAGLGYGSYIVISARLPELVSGSSVASTAAETEGYGRNVDIVVDDEAGEDEFPVGDDAGPVQTGEPEGRSSRDPDDEVGDLEEVAEDDETAADGGDELVEEVEEVAAAPADSPARTYGESEDIDENSVDTLPDIGGFAGDFESEGAVVVEENDSDGGFGGSGRGGRAHGVEQDPEIIAKALQTVMKRDE